MADNSLESRMARIDDNNHRGMPHNEGDYFTIKDIQDVGYMLSPLRCINPNCEAATSGNVSFSQYSGDACCEECGEDQEQFLVC